MINPENTSIDDYKDKIEDIEPVEHIDFLLLS